MEQSGAVAKTKANYLRVRRRIEYHCICMVYILSVLSERGSDYVSISDLKKIIPCPESCVEQALDKLLALGIVKKVNNGFTLSNYGVELIERLRKILGL
ncbi:MAG: hypothetical protein B6U85_09220 [Desulfurococcales archaeon ex4484_42]|nr:MAG: hypothetical protein B6U85_09220 [Desulfurococcales archaeon ex4484_42]